MYASSADIDVVDEAGSIYNGDENHKVWTGSQDRLDEIATESPYDFFGGNGMSNGNASTLGRTARARQISAPIPVPPPPKDESKKRKEKKSKSSSSQSLSGTLRPKPVYGNTLVRGIPMHHQMQMPHNMNPYGPPMPMPMQALPASRFHTFSHRAHSASVPHLQMIPMQMHHPMHHPAHGHHPGPMSVAMLPQQYATLQHPRSKSKKKKDKMSNGIPLGIPVPPVPPPIFAYPPPNGSMMHDRPIAMSNRKLAQSANGLDASDNSDSESQGGTGIYRRKGHLNERAFSYSIRQEHRSRSHGSLASLQFNNPPDLKKEREIAQMMSSLDLNDDATIYRRTQPQQQMSNANQIHSQSMIMPMNGGTFGKHQRKHQ